MGKLITHATDVIEFRNSSSGDMLISECYNNIWFCLRTTFERAYDIYKKYLEFHWNT